VALTWLELEQRVRKLTSTYRDTGDRIYTVECGCGILLGATKVGRHRGHNKEVGHPVLRQIPRQLKIDGDLWRDIVGCTKSRPDYLIARGHASCVPGATK
jgi:hypothetical protein